MNRQKPNSIKAVTSNSSIILGDSNSSTKAVDAAPEVGGVGAPQKARRDGSAPRSKSLSAIRPLPRRGLSREEAAIYIGVSAAKLDDLVRTGRMPGPKRIDARKVWDVRALDLAFDDLPSEGNSWDDV